MFISVRKHFKKCYARGPQNLCRKITTCAEFVGSYISLIPVHVNQQIIHVSTCHMCQHVNLTCVNMSKSYCLEGFGVLDFADDLVITVG